MKRLIPFLLLLVTSTAFAATGLNKMKKLIALLILNVLLISSTAFSATSFVERSDLARKADIDPNVVFNVKTEYGAKGDGVTLFDGNTSVGSKTFTSATANFSSSDVGKVITIINAGGTNIDQTTTISSINSTTSIELSDNAVAAVTNGMFTYGTDDTSSIQAAIDAIPNTTNRHGTVFFPSGIYIVNGSFTQENNSQIGIPTVCLSDSNIKTVGIELRGPVSQKQSNPNMVSVGGAIIYSTKYGTDGSYSIISGKCDSDANDFTQVVMTLENIAFRTVQDPTNTAVNFNFVNGAQGNNVLIDAAGLKSGDYAEPTHSDSFGLKTPGNGNNTTNFWDTLKITGFYNNLLVTEHGVYNNLRLFYSVYAMTAAATTHSIIIGMVSAEHDKNILRCTGTTPEIFISLLDIEHNGGSWDETVYDVDDASSYCSGKLMYNVDTTGGASGSFIKNKGFKMATSSMAYGEEITALNVGQLKLTNGSTAPSSASGGALVLNQNNGTVISSGDRLSVISSSGTSQSTGAVLFGSSIATFAAQNFTSVASGSDLAILTTPINSSTRTEKFRVKANGGILVTISASQTIAAGNTITDDGCGTIKSITSSGAVTTDTTNTFTAPAVGNAGCCMNVVNVGSNNITLDNNANFVSNGAADVVLGAGDTAYVCSSGASGKWYQIGSTGNN